MSYLCRSNCVSKETKIFLIRFSLFLGFLYGGAFLFMMIEEEPTKEQIEKNKAELEILKIITMDKYNMTDDEFGILVNKLKTTAYANLPEWSFENGTSFTLQLLTTIGYGNITPRTAAGQIVTIVYAIFGIPLTILTLKSIGEGYNSKVKWLITKFENCLCRKQNESKNLELKVLLGNIFVLTSIVFSAAAASQATNGWSIRQGVYVWFITLTTVGFGDFVPEVMMKIQPSEWIIPGLCFMAGVVDSMVEYFTKADFELNRNNSKCFCCNNSLQSAQVEYDGTRKHSSNDLGLEEAHQQNGMQDPPEIQNFKN